MTGMTIISNLFLVEFRLNRLGSTCAWPVCRFRISLRRGPFPFLSILFVLSLIFCGVFSLRLSQFNSSRLKSVLTPYFFHLDADKALELVTQFKSAAKEEDRISLAKTVASAATTGTFFYLPRSCAVPILFLLVVLNRIVSVTVHFFCFGTVWRVLSLSQQLFTTAADVKYAMAKEGISKPTIELLKSKSESAQKFGAYLLHCVCYGSGTLVSPIFFLFRLHFAFF